MRGSRAGAAPLALARLLGPASARPWLVLQFGPGGRGARDGGGGRGAAPLAKGSLALVLRRPPLPLGHRHRGVFMGPADDAEEGRNPEREESSTPSVSATSPGQGGQPVSRPPADSDEVPGAHGGESGRKSSPQGAEVKGRGPPGKGAGGSRGNAGKGASGGAGKGGLQGQYSQASETRAKSSYWLPSSFHWLTSKDKGGWCWQGGSQPISKPPPTLTPQGWDNILLQTDPMDALRELSWRSMLKNDKDEYVHPDLDWLRDMIEIKYGQRSDLDMRRTRGTGKILINHVIQVVRQTPRRLRTRWAALLHDVGKPATVAVDGERGNKVTFHRHEAVGAAMVGSILSRYGYGLNFQREVAALVLRSGRIRMVDKFNDQGARRLISVSGPLFTDQVDLYLADCTSASAKKQQEHHDRGVMLTKLVEDVLFRDKSRSKRPPIDGHEVMALTGLPAGVALGRLMRLLRKDYLLRGPFSKEEAIQVVSRLHEEYSNQPDPVRPSRRGQSEEDILKTLKDSFNNSKEVLVFRVQLEPQRNGGGRMDLPEIFRDVIVHRKMNLFDFALMIAHAFEFDFDDKFSFYRRRQGTVCPGAAAAFSGISETLVPHKASHPPNKASPGIYADDEAVQQCSAGPEYELLASTTGIPRDLDCDGQAYTYDVRYSEELGVWINPQGRLLRISSDESSPENNVSVGGGAAAADLKILEHVPTISVSDALPGDPGTGRSSAEASPAPTEGGATSVAQAGGLSAEGLQSEEEHRDLGDDEAFWNRKADTLAYPLMLPQKGQANICNTFIGSLFDRSRRSMLLVLETGGPWRFSIDFVQSRERKEYELPPRVIARMGYPPRQYFHGSQGPGR